MTKPLLSICLITYNHAPYIREAIEGVLMQRANFNWELIIADDCSTDGTREILSEYRQKHPDLIKLILQEKNVGAAQNWFELITFPTTKYIAYIEGDDYWCDPRKLQLQVDFLENNEDYGLVHHEADYLFQKDGRIIRNHHKSNKIHVSDGYVFEELLINNNIYAPTVVFRTKLIENFISIGEENWKSFLMGDYVMWLEFSKHCKFHYLEASMAVYRVLEGSASKNITFEKAMLFLNSYYDIRLFFLKRYPTENCSEEIIEQWRLSASLSYSIKYKMNKEARYFASKLKITNARILLKRMLVVMPGLFRYIQKKNRL